MRWLEAPQDSLAAELALDEALLEAVDQGAEEVLRVWSWERPSVVLGALGRWQDELDVGACEAAGVGIFRRSSGGGTVLLDHGCLCFSLLLSLRERPELLDLRRASAWINARLVAALAVPGLESRGLTDLAIAGRKVSGSAQRRVKNAMLHHGTLLWDFDAEKAARFLREPARRPEYRGDRRHAAFLANLPLGPGELSQRLRDGLSLCDFDSELPKLEMAMADRFANSDWIRRF